ncbi:acyl-CoA dehydrogenase family protein [Sphingobium phenoxybenzoativorans]|uniref:Acyl-[acyl-carrier-protein] dehydrogenase MbtN n=1 Tax=Sphingobium phenoxybenzoativorans TaxID=1592790 RepID=A0A975K9K6_9SPHN|nr:acyl-CoA dehydrogenase family protein [Sphingobium phenoxybenzoativorans]QUT06874.1 acyl-CoA dehydrogenase family protein [Sphingobium phenoxybenzoativorans]
MESVLGLLQPDFMAADEITMFADSVARFVADRLPPARMARFREQGIVDRQIWTEAAEAGLMGISIPEEFGGAGGDFRHEVVLAEQLGRAGIEGWDLTLHNAVVAPYVIAYGTQEQKERWLPGICSGEIILAIAMTEPGTGSDLQAIRTSAVDDGDSYVINGSKTFITNGQHADLVLVIARTGDGKGSRSLSMIGVETRDAPGFSRGANLEKIGRECADTSELFFNDLRVPKANRIGEEGAGFSMLMEKLPQERLVIAVQALAGIEHVLALTIDYVKQRKAFGQAIIDFQNTQFVLADCKTEAVMARAFVERCIQLLLEGRLDSATASMAKAAVSEMQGRIVDRCLQLFGGYGYMAEYPIAQAYKDARVTRIYGGTTEIMKLLIARTL